VKGNGKKSIFIKIFAALLVLMIFFLSKGENQEKLIELFNMDSLLLDDINVINSISADDEIDDIACYDGHIMMRKDNKLVRYSREGNKEWEKEFNFTDFYVTFGDIGIYVSDRNQGDIYYLNSEGDTIGRFKSEGRIKSIKESGENILIHLEDDGNESIEILDTSGKLIARKMLEDKYILDYCFLNKINRYAVSTLNLENEGIKSEIQVYSLNGELNWDLKLDDELIMYISFIDDKGLVAMSSNILYYIDEGNIVWQKDISSPKGICVDEKSIYILYGSTFEVISRDGAAKESLSLKEEYNKFILANGYAVLYGEENLMGFKGAKKMFKYKAEEPIIKVIEGNGNLIVLYENRIDIVTF